MKQYRKLIAAVVGLGILFAKRYGFDLGGQDQILTDLVLSIATALSVYHVRNESPNIKRPT